MGQVIAFANQKGGVAKTTSTYNVGVALAMKGKKTLIIDLDPQASLTISAGLEPLEQEQTIVTALKKERNKLKTSILSLMDNLDIVTSRPELAQLEMELIGRSVRETILKRALEPVRAGYDFILIDCPPQLSILTINALSACDWVIIPCKTDYLAYRGLELLQDTIEDVKAFVNPGLETMGVIATLYEARVADDKAILKALQEQHNVLGVVKKRAIAKKGVYDGLSVSQQAPSNDVAAAYERVSQYIIENGGK